MGVAAHIYAAASGGPRSLEELSAEERKSIENAIWLCQNHGKLVDDDTSSYTVEELKEIKRCHEEQINAELTGERERPEGVPREYGLVALGPSIIGIGRVVEGEDNRWTVRIRDFVRGDRNDLLAFAESLDDRPALDRYVAADELGDGRVIEPPVRWEEDEHGYLVEVGVAPRVPRDHVQDLGTTLALGDDGDLVFEDGEFKMVTGREALRQKLLTTLSYQKGESELHPGFGSRIAEYHALYRDSAWLDRMLKLEVVRLASIPYKDEARETAYLPLRCVERVGGLEVLDDEPTHGRIPIRLDLDIAGMKPVEVEVPVYVGEQDPDLSDP